MNNVLYNISSDNGSYDATEGCLVINKSTSDDMMSALVGKDIFGEDFQGQFTGVVFKVAEGSGQVKVEAETSGTMLLNPGDRTTDLLEGGADCKTEILWLISSGQTQNRK